MKHFAPYALMLLFSLQAATGFSQNPNGNKPKQFSSYPDVINCTEAELSRVFSGTAGQDISLNFSNDFMFSGKITSNLVKYSNLQTAVIKSPVFNNSILNISKRINQDNSITYIGRIINVDYFDGYELKKNITGNYQLIKIETDKVIQPCFQN
ncbi:MAG: hypothetical protein WCH29_01610 [Chitinophagaceae bacterium]